MEQQAEQTRRDLRCTICGIPLSPRPAVNAGPCQHRVDSIGFAEFFWEEA
jgi:hypothetical protein